MCRAVKLQFDMCRHVHPWPLLYVACDTMRSNWVPITEGIENCQYPPWLNDLTVRLGGQYCDNCFHSRRQTNGGSADGQNANGTNGTNGAANGETGEYYGYEGA